MTLAEFVLFLSVFKFLLNFFLFNSMNSFPNWSWILAILAYFSSLAAGVFNISLIGYTGSYEFPDWLSRLPKLLFGNFLLFGYSGDLNDYQVPSIGRIGPKLHIAALSDFHNKH